LSTVKKKKIAILGGGPAAMAAAFELTDRPDWRDRFEITVYQVGWRLGGKCASGRNPRAHERIEEHGLHVLMGFYENTFRLIRGCYDELARRGLRRPGDPLATWQEALKPQSFVVLEENVNGRWIHWPFDFGVKPGLPGDDPGPRDAWDVILDILTLMRDEFRRSREARRPARLLGRIIGTIAGWVTGLLSPIRLASDSPAPPGPAGLDTLPEWLRDQVRERVGAELTNIDLRAEDGLLEIARRIARRTPGGGALEPRDRPG
jgi:uncharacterized protein with NAD-binding domain and iron-sulfur cluster